jgi:hypothetical protein
MLRVLRVLTPSLLCGLVLGCATASTAPSSRSPNPSAAPASSVLSSSATPNPTQTPSASPSLGISFDPAADLVTTFDSAVFQPAFTIKLPADWTTAERDAEAFQIYFGAEDYELTIDHTYHARETATAAMARLLRAPSITAQGKPKPITIGGRSGLTVVVDASTPVLWSDSGYHINVANLRVRLLTVPVEGGETVSIFVVANTGAEQFEAVDKIGLRMLATLKWV